jgi:hypothetical protein
MFPVTRDPRTVGPVCSQGRRDPAAKLTLKKLQMKRQALQKLNRQANENSRSFDTERPN